MGKCGRGFPPLPKAGTAVCLCQIFLPTGGKPLPQRPTALPLSDLFQQEGNPFHTSPLLSVSDLSSNRRETPSTLCQIFLPTGGKPLPHFPAAGAFVRSFFPTGCLPLKLPSTLPHCCLPLSDLSSNRRETPSTLPHSWEVCQGFSSCWRETPSTKALQQWGSVSGVSLLLEETPDHSSGEVWKGFPSCWKKDLTTGRETPSTLPHCCLPLSDLSSNRRKPLPHFPL